MNKFIFLTFAFLSWAFYEMSGGADFEPYQPVAEAAPETSAEPRAESAVRTASASIVPTASAAPAPEVTRAAYTAPSYDLRAPVQEELDAVDPAVLASFGDVLKRDEAKAESAEANIELASADPGMVVDQVVTDVREITGNRVNMRNGPGTDFSVVDKLRRGDSVEVLAEPGNGWLKLRLSDTGRIGWMADFLVSSAN